LRHPDRLRVWAPTQGLLSNVTDVGSQYSKSNGEPRQNIDDREFLRHWRSGINRPFIP
jgi:hypothetical protein